ncbi:uncharacterized protein N7484_000047 [Penicillium longicatenatum]|uniref:uncharacterized protein n=1 Tax=Penicillium longicatenatum TaxID=1561947 RepID=UPI002548C260|nr:uncharacterized protein N7484_000047 [Penicillium longicatenatum]KAJ5660675.1 hypothetical protein N7484_000047 [Penicillium longicatenatum]
MSLTEVYAAVQSAWVEGRLENVLQRQKELAGLHAALTRHRSGLVAAFSKDLETIEDGASVEIDLALDAIKQLYDQLDFPSSLDRERSVQAGQTSPLNSVALGPVLIQAALPCPLSSAILPLAAAVAAGSCCVVLLCVATPAINQVLHNIIQNGMDQEAIGLVDVSVRSEELKHLRFESAALQDSETTEDFANVMRQINPAIRIHIPTTGLPAIFVDRSTSELETVATWLEKSILNGSRQHSGSMPRVCFVDEFVIEQLTWLVQQRLDWVGKAPASSDQSTATEIADLLTSTFPSLKKKGLSVTADKLSRLIVLQSTDSIDPETIGPVASQVTKSYHGILLIPTTSLDHGIDLWNKVNNGMPSPAIYVFGGGKETWYLSQFINSEHCFVNCIPPRSFCMIAPSSSHDTFALPFRPDNFSRNKVILQDSNLNYQGSRHGYLNLKKISQPKGGRLSYFEQGLIVGLSVTAIAASTFAFTIFKGLKQVYY